MASQVNSQFAYINLINGETVWERLRIVRNFLEDRRAALAMKPAGELKRQAILAKIEEATKLSEKLNAEAELIEFDAMQATQEDGYKKLDDELAFLVEYEAKLAQAAEATRILDKTDDEMYQLNMPQEVYMRNLRKIETEQVAKTLGISQATAEESMRIPTMRTQLLATAKAITLQLPAGATQDEVLQLQQVHADLVKEGINLEAMPLSVQEELQLNSSYLLTGTQQ